MALKDATANQIGGCSASVIGLGIDAVYKSAPNGFADDTAITLQRIGGATAGTLRDSAYATKALRPEKATGAVADGAVVANLYVNHTGKALVADDVVVAVAP